MAVRPRPSCSTTRQVTATRPNDIGRFALILVHNDLFPHCGKHYSDVGAGVSY